MPPLWHYVVVRSDLPRGAQFAQLVHAAGESVLEPVPHDTRAAVLGAKDEVDLRAVALALEGAGIAHRRIIETEGGFADQLVAVGVTPRVKDELVTRCLGGLQTLK